ncbi:MAG: 6-phosphogluconolactonase [Aquificaceae bacterium]|nr:6-phosphogluconolactonase [Aquificaceae bacterium]
MVFIKLQERRILISETPHQKATVLLKRLIKLIINRKQRCNIALAGGQTPLELYRMLSLTTLPWENLHFYIGDERYFKLDSNLINYKAVKQRLGDKSKLSFFKTELEPQDCALDYDVQLPEYLDLALLGLGEDGHTASLFNPIHKITKKVCVSKSPDGLLRISLTDEYLSLSCYIIFLFTSERKKEAFGKLLSNRWPAGSILGRNRTYVITNIKPPKI